MRSGWVVHILFLISLLRALAHPPKPYSGRIDRRRFGCLGVFFAGFAAVLAKMRQSIPPTRMFVHFIKASGSSSTYYLMLRSAKIRRNLVDS